MKFYLLSYFSTALIFLGIDSVWLTVMGDRFYKPILGDSMLEKFSLYPAVAFYLLYIVGIQVFAITPALSTGKWVTALTYGALFGLFAYATYDLTNQATLKRWSTLLSVVDMSWGTIVTGVSAALGFIVADAINRWTSG